MRVCLNIKGLAGQSRQPLYEGVRSEFALSTRNDKRAGGYFDRSYLLRSLMI